MEKKGIQRMVVENKVEEIRQRRIDERMLVKTCSHPHFHHCKVRPEVWRREEHGKSEEEKGADRVIRKSREWRKGGQTCISGSICGDREVPAPEHIPSWPSDTELWTG